MLKDMFDKQIQLQERLGVSGLPKMMPEMLPIAVTSLVVELGEALSIQQEWKPWKKNCELVDSAKLDSEVADVIHFAINFCLYLGYNAEEVYKVFLEKNGENHARQDNNY